MGKVQVAANTYLPFWYTQSMSSSRRENFTSPESTRDRPPHLILTLGTAEIPIPLDVRSWFVMGSYRLAKKFQVGAYYSHEVNRADDTNLPAHYSKDWVVSGRYDFNSYFYGKIEGHFLHGTGLGYFESTNPNGLKPNSNMLAAKIGFSF